MNASRWGPIAALTLLAVLAIPVQAAGKISPGQEFVYAGTLEWKQSGVGGVPTIIHRAPLKLWALVTTADPAQGYTVLLMRDIRPEKRQGQDNLDPFAEVFTERFGPDLGRVPGPPRPRGSVYGEPLIPLIWNRPMPFVSFPDLTVGHSWKTTEFLALPGVRSPWVDYAVVGQTKIAGRTCVKINTTVQGLPQRTEQDGGSTELSAYAGTLCLERDTGLIAYDQWKASARYVVGQQRALIDVSAIVALKETRRLTPAEVASRIKQAGMIAQVERTAFGREPEVDRKKRVEEANQAIAQFRREYAASVYAAALTPIKTSLEPEARRLALRDGPAPAFMLKDLEGKEQTLAAYHGKLILLNFFASWCGPCNGEAPHLEKEYWQKLRDRGVVVVGIDVAEEGSPEEKARTFQQKHGLTYPILLDVDGKVSEAYRVKGLPNNVIIDREGKVRYIDAGFNPEAVNKILQQLMGQ